MPKGSCLCGAIQYDAKGRLESIDHCHCSMCRRTHGSAFATFGRVARDDFQLTAGRDDLQVYASSEAVKRSFCRHCGSRLLFEHSAMPDHVFLALGSLDEDPGGRPEGHIFVGSKASWFEITDELPQHDEYPPGVTD